MSQWLTRSELLIAEANRATKFISAKAPVTGLSRRFYVSANRDESNLGVPKGIRTPVTTVKGSCPRPLDDGDLGASNSFVKRLLGDSHLIGTVKSFDLVEISGIEPLTSCMPCKRSPS
jgi:hypothetical protein